jgi:hypothetical protein
MTAENLAKHRLDPNIAFWRNLKEGSDYFEIAKDEPRVSVANQQYAFSGDAPVMAAVAQKQQSDDQQVTTLTANGAQPVKLVYADGGQHESFRQALYGDAGGSLAVDASARKRLGDISRPEALAAGPQEVVLTASGKPRQGAPAAYASQRSEAGQARTTGAAPQAGAATDPAAPVADDQGPSVFGRMRSFFGG